MTDYQLMIDLSDAIATVKDSIESFGHDDQKAVRVATIIEYLLRVVDYLESQQRLLIRSVFYD